MEQILITRKRAKMLTDDKKLLNETQARLGCQIRIEDGNTIVLSCDDPYKEFTAKSVMQAFGRGFDMDKALKLLQEDYYFKSINLKDLFRTKEHILRMKARLIGREGKTKEYMEDVSGSSIAISGNTISVIGTLEGVRIAETAIQTLLVGGTHKKAYKKMEDARKRASGGAYA